MAFRNIIVESPARITLKNSQLIITEKQYESIDILLGKLTQEDEPFQCEQLSIF